MVISRIRVPLLVSLVILALLIGGIAACGQLPATPYSPSDEIRIGVVAPITGEYADSIGFSTKYAAELAVRQINSAGGLVVDGRYIPVRLFLEDDHHDPQMTVQVTQKLITEDKVIALVGYPSSVVAIPAADVAEEAGIPMISSSSTSPATTLGKTYIFRVAFVDSFQGRVLANFIHEELHATKAAVLYNRDITYSNGLATIFREVFKQLGGDVVAFESYASKDDAWDEQLQVIQVAKPEVLFLPSYEDSIISQTNQIATMGITATIIGADAWSYIDPMSLTTPSLDKAYYTAHWSPNIANKKAQAFMGAYFDAYNEMPSENAALTYDALGLLFQTIQDEQHATPERIRDGLHATELYTGVTGTITYPNNSGDPLRSVVILQIVGGQPVFYQQVNP